MPAHRADGRAGRVATGRAAASGLAALALLTAGAIPAGAAAPTATETPTRLAIVVALAAPPRASGLIPADELAALTADDGALAEALESVGAERVTLAVDPLIAASVNALGADAPASALAWTTRLDRAPQDRFPLLTADADPTLLRQAGAALPALGTVWTTPGTTSAADVAAFAAAGAARVLVADGDLVEWPDPASALAAVDGVGIAVVDTATSAALVAAAAQPSSATLGALRAAIAGDGDRGSVVAAVGRDVVDWPGLATVLSALGGDLGLQLVGLDQLSGATSEAALGDGAQPAPRLDAFRSVVAAETADAAFAAIAADPAAIRDERRLRTLLLASAGWHDAAAWQEAVATAVEDSRTLRSSVRIAEADSLFLADRSSIPVAISNDLDQAVTVVVTARAADGRLDIDDAPVTVEVPAGARTSVSFAASAVSNGTVAVTARLTSVDGMPIGAPAVAAVNVQAGWETPIAAGGAGVLLLMVVLGIVRTVRRRRRAGAEPEAEASADE
ncbi:MAG: hypothetical protein BGO95_02365 [Micrococcales bacterium 73-13]|nr:MAG: hypothetical protein BGO95_02365 [Micrococcales bacterium 73-13]